MAASIFSAQFTCLGENPKVVIDTIFGNIFIELYINEAPITVDNILHYVNTGYYDGTFIHRTTKYQDKGFGIIQGGLWRYIPGWGVGYYPTDRESIINESYNGLSNARGTIAMARTSDPNSADSQFFINQTDNLFFDKAQDPEGIGYCVFGEVLYGMDVVDFINFLEHLDPNDDPNFWGLNEVPHYPVSGGWYLVEIQQAFQAPEGFWLRGDINYDGIVDYLDIAIYSDNWLSHYRHSNIDEQGLTDLLDFAILAHNYRRTSIWNRFARGDIDNNGKVDFRDYCLLINNWAKTGIDLRGDLNLDQKVDYFDLARFAEDWQKTKT